MTQPDINTPEGMREQLLRQVVATGALTADMPTGPEYFGRTAALCNAYMAARLLDALMIAAPDVAAAVCTDIAAELDAGALPVYAANRATGLGHDPQQWITEATR
ncbi:hypothetical protein [Embleya sp. NPDC020630]|uniref:hypothetical protein n=1 Tax=Embleya sp. NPDC020630 TaxID=3363979 RepID=UPI00378F88B0